MKEAMANPVWHRPQAPALTPPALTLTPPALTLTPRATTRRRACLASAATRRARRRGRRRAASWAWAEAAPPVRARLMRSVKAPGSATACAGKGVHSAMEVLGLPPLVPPLVPPLSLCKVGKRSTASLAKQPSHNSHQHQQRSSFWLNATTSIE